MRSASYADSTGRVLRMRRLTETLRSLRLSFVRTVTLLCLLCVAISAYSAEESVVAHLERIQPEAWGPPYVIASQRGILHGEVETLVVLYAYQIGEGRDRNHWQYLIAFERGKPTTPSILVGGGPQRFSELDIADGVVVLSGKALGSGDAMCCPSNPVQLRYIYLNGHLVAKAGGT